MASESGLTIKGAIEFLFSKLPFQQAQQSIKDTGKAADTVSRQLDGMGYSLKALGGTLTQAFGAAALGALIKTSIVQFAQLERSFNALKIQMEGLGINSATNLPKVKAFLEQLHNAGDGLMSETVPAFQKFLGLTKDVNAALSMVKLASNMGESGLVDFSGAVTTLTSVLSGRPARSLKELGINIQEAADGSVNAAEAMRKLFQVYNDGLSDIADTQDALDRQGAAWESFKVQMGALGSWLGRSMKAAWEPVFSYWKVAEKELDDLSQAAEIKRIARHKAELTEGRRKAEEIAGQAAKEEAEKQAAELAKKRSEIERTASQQLLGERIAAEEEGSQRRLDLELKLLEKKRAESIRAAREVGASTAQIEATFNLARKRLVEEHAEALRQADAEAELEHQGYLQRRAEAEQAAFEESARLAREQFDLDQALLEQRIAMLEPHYEEALDLQREALLKQMVEELRIRGATDEAAIAIMRRTRLKMQELERRHTKVVIDLAEQELQSKREAAALWANTIASVHATIFGESKALAIAAAIIDTWAAANKTWAMYAYTPYGYAAVAAVIAAGLANVARIRATERKGSSSGGGGKSREAFDDPINDRMVFHAGRKSIQDFVTLTQQGMRQGFQQLVVNQHPALQGAEASVRGGDTHFHIGTLVADDAGIRTLRRRMERVGRHDVSRLAR